jgi:GNAT superfamily N-acetyltransferase
VGAIPDAALESTRGVPVGNGRTPLDALGLGIELTYSTPELLTSAHDLADFTCGNPALDAWLAGRALGNQALGSSRTWVVVEQASNRVVAFYASSTASVLRSEAPGRLGRQQPHEIPAILLGRMAVHVEHQGMGLGAALLKHFMLKAIEVSASIGVRLVLVHAKDERTSSFYEHFGFVESPVDPLTFMMLLPTNRS